MAPSSDATTRRRILHLLKIKTLQTAEELSAELGVSAVAVRCHLGRLREDGFVAGTARQGGVGRPATLWSLTDLAHGEFPDAHVALLRDVLDALKASGSISFEEVLRDRAERELRSWRERARGVEDADARGLSVAEARDEQGYMARWESDEKGGRLIQNHCPIRAAATCADLLCDAELETLRRYFGDRVRVDREEHALSGDSRCSYRVSRRSFPV